MERFVRVLRAKSLSTAARELGLSQPLVTKRVRALEGHLGARLLNPTTRTLNLTEISAEYYDFGQRALSPKSFAVLHMRDAIAAKTRRNGKVMLGKS